VSEFAVASKKQQRSFARLWWAVPVLLLLDSLTIRFSVLKFSDMHSWRYWGNQMVSGAFLFGLFAVCGALLSQLQSRGKRRWWLTLFAVLTAAVLASLVSQVNHFLVYQKPFSSFSVRFVFENPSLFFDLAGENVAFLQTVLRTTPTFLLFVFFFYVAGREKKVSITRLSVGALCFLASLLVGTFSWAAAPVLQHSLLSAGVAFTDFFRTPKNFAENGMQGRRKAAHLKCGQQKAHETPTSVVWVIGESLVASRTSLYGYERKTTEFLLKEWQEGRLVRFNNAVSIGIVTRISVPYLFFGLQGPDRDGRLYRSSSIFDYAKKAKLRTAYIGAQELRWGNQDKIIINENVDWYHSGVDFDRNAAVSKGAEDFTVLTEGAIPYLKSIQSPFFLALHMDGSHYPYSQHSLPQFKRFLPELTPNDDNSYDNTVVQFDAYMRELMSVVRAQHPKAWVFYSSDHGQNLGESSRFNSGYSDNVIRNPLFVLPPLGTEVERLEQQSGAPVSQADLFATTLELFGCETPEALRSDSLSLLQPVPEHRLRIVSGLMASHRVDDTSALVLPDRTVVEVDEGRGSVTTQDGRVSPLSGWQAPARLFFERKELGLRTEENPRE
jgi:glucan phosphoethanolaminetransferase (alkaline phosphatase superfamily)